MNEEFIVTQRKMQAIVAEKDFYLLAKEWKYETAMLSLIPQKVKHPAYRKIISMGWVVVPLILKELEREPDHWFWALRNITGANPVQDSHRGNMKEVAQDWIEWGKSQQGLNND